MALQPGRASSSSAERPAHQRRDVERQEAVMAQPAQIANRRRCADRGCRISASRCARSPCRRRSPDTRRGRCRNCAAPCGCTMPQPRISSQSPPAPIFSSPPVARAADIDLGRGLGEREIARPEAHRQIVDAEKGAAELDQAALEVAHMGRAVDHQPLDLVEHRRMGRVVVAAEGAARHDDADRRLLRQHRADLHRRGVGAQHERDCRPARSGR